MGKLPPPQQAGQDLGLVFPRQPGAGLPSVQGVAPSSLSRLLEGAQMAKSKHQGDAATSGVSERGHGLTTPVKTMQSSQRRQQKDFSTEVKQRQRLGHATRQAGRSGLAAASL